jgi:hypothetical protein
MRILTSPISRRTKRPAKIDSWLFARTLVIAQDTALRDKRRALGRALGAGVMNDDAQIDEELLFIRAVADIDEMHIRLLAHVADWEVPVHHPNLPEILDVDPGLGRAAMRLLDTLEMHGLLFIEEAPGGPYPKWQTDKLSFEATSAGHEFLRRLREEQP